MPSSQKCTIVDCVSDRIPPPTKGLSDAVTVRFVIHDFEYRAQEPGEWIDSPFLRAHGHEWKLRMYPRGPGTSPTDEEENVSASLIPRQTRSTAALNGTFLFRGKKLYLEGPKPILRWAFGEPFGVEDLKKKRDSFIEKCLEPDGSFVLDCDIRIAVEHKRDVWYPKKLEHVLAWVMLYCDETPGTSDVVFSVGECLFWAHKHVLALRCKNLYEIVKDSDSNSGTRIPLDSMRGDVFHCILEFVYTVAMPIIKSQDLATNLLVAADCYDCVQLKLYVESVLVDKFLTAENAAELLIFADFNSCALLKEAAINVLVADPESMKMAMTTWAQIEVSNRLLKELLLASNNKLAEVLVGTTSEIDVTVAALREKLGAENLEQDGSREDLVRRWNTHQGQVQRQVQYQGHEDDPTTVPSFRSIPSCSITENTTLSGSH